MTPPRVTFTELDEFLRLYQIGFVAVWPVLGLAAAAGWSPGAVAALVLVSATFNTFGGMLNDICDLPSDRLAVERRDRWLVVGAVPVRAAAAIVVAQVPIAVGIHVAAGFRPAALGWLAAAFAGQAFYDVLGKRLRVPPVAEAGQALAAGCLVVYGSTCVVEQELSWLTAMTATVAAAMLQLANGFHGGLRDLHDDRRARVRTTPIWLGCGTRGADVVIAPAMTAYAAACLSLLLIASAFATAGAPAAVRAAVLFASGVVVILFGLLHRVRQPAWELLLKLHVSLLMVPIMTAYTPLLGVQRSGVLALVYLAPSLPLACRLIRTARLRWRPAGVRRFEPLALRVGRTLNRIAKQRESP